MFNTDSFLFGFLALRRGRPAKVFNDKGTQIIAGQNEISELRNLNKSEIEIFMLESEIECFSLLFFAFPPPLEDFLFHKGMINEEHQKDWM